MKQIIKNLYVGEHEEVKEALKSGFAVASMTKEGDSGHRSLLGYTTLGAPKDENYYYVIKGKHFVGNLVDAEDPNYIPEEVIDPALDFIKKHYDKGEKVFINCQQGRSRGPTTTLMFLRAIGEFPYPFKTSKKIFKGLYPKYDPGHGMETYARTHWTELGEKYA